MIYADYNGSAPLLNSVREHLKKRVESDLFANPNAIHSMGQRLFGGIEKCRGLISEVVGCYPDQVFFNSGSSEGISQILFSVLEFAPKEKNIVITSPIEHIAVSNALQFYGKHKHFKIMQVDVTESGVISLESLRKILDSHASSVAAVAIMAVNNETGVLQPIKEIAHLCGKYQIEFFSDTTQLIGKTEFNFETSGIDYAVCSGHKLGALTGSGFIIAREPTKLRTHVFGSHQEKGLRGGTQNYLGIETLAIALKDFQSHQGNLNNLFAARVEFEANIKKEFPEVVIIGDQGERLAGTTLISYPGIHGQAVQIELESLNIFVTTSAACSDNQPETSAVLKSMKIGDDIGRGVIRISLSYTQGKKEYQEIEKALSASYNKLKKIKSY